MGLNETYDELLLNKAIYIFKQNKTTVLWRADQLIMEGLADSINEALQVMIMAHNLSLGLAVLNVA